MSNRNLYTGSVALTCLTLCGTATAAAPGLNVFYHERLEFTASINAAGQPQMSFDAYGRHFEVDLEPNNNISRAVPADRTDIQPYSGTVAGQSGSWVRLTHTRDGWRGIVNDGQDLFAIEPASELQNSATEALPEDASNSTPVIYRLADTILSREAGYYCGTDDVSPASASGGTSALQAFTQLTQEFSQKKAAAVPARQLVVGVVADHTFTDAVGPDPEGAIIARMNIVDGIWSTQVGIRIVLAPVTIFTDATDRFSSTPVATDLLSEVASFRAELPAHSDVGLTHLMTGRKMHGNIIGIAYLGSICKGAQSVSLSQSTISTTLGALIAAHELGHNFNAIHDGVPGVCSTTAQTYLMAPTLNFSQQFSACSLNQIELHAEAASCVIPISASAGGSPPPPPVPAGAAVPPGTISSGNAGMNGATGGGDSASGGNGVTGGGGRVDVAWLVFLGGTLGLQLVRIHLKRASCAT